MSARSRTLLRLSAVVLPALFVASGCAAPDPVPADAGAPAEDAGSDSDAGLPFDAGVKKQAGCASVFGASLTNAFGRVDGTVVAVVPPGDPGCALPNSDHVVVQVAFDGGVHRMVVNVKSDFGDPHISMRTLRAPLPSPAFAEGWHPGLSLDYVNTLGVHSDGGWDSLSLDEASQRVMDRIDLGTPISVYATSSGGAYAGSAHKVHRNGSNNDGAIVIDPTSATPTWLLFRFANQSF